MAAGPHCASGRDGDAKDKQEYQHLEGIKRLPAIDEGRHGTPEDQARHEHQLRRRLPGDTDRLTLPRPVSTSSEASSKLALGWTDGIALGCFRIEGVLQGDE